MCPYLPHNWPKRHNRTCSDPKIRDIVIIGDECDPHRVAYSVGYESRSLNASRLDSLEDIHRTFCLQTLQLRVDTDECPTPNDAITDRDTITGLTNMCDTCFGLPDLHMTTIFLEGHFIKVLVTLSMSDVMAVG